MAAAKSHWGLTDISVALALTACIHKTDKAVHKTAKRLYRLADAYSRAHLDMVRDAKRPLSVIALFLKELPPMTRPRAQVALDLETLGTSPDSVILAIGAVAVCEETGERRKFYSICNANAQPGRTISQSTLNWWSGQSDAARVAFDQAHQPEAALLSDVLCALTHWIGELGLTHDVYVWGNGSSFDVAMLEHAYKQSSDFVPWDFRKTRDMRTLRDICLRLQLPIEVERVGTHHNALDDAEFQANVIMESLRQITITRQFIEESEAFAADEVATA